MKKLYISVIFNVIFLGIIVSQLPVFKKLFTFNSTSYTDNSAPIDYNSFDKLTAVINNIQKSYYKNLTTKEIVDYAVEGIMDRLDQYSEILKNKNVYSVSKNTLMETKNNLTSIKEYNISQTSDLFSNNINNNVSVITSNHNFPEINNIDSTNYKTKSFNNIGYIAISSFKENTYLEAYHLIAKNFPNVKALVIDLRNNGGGYVEQAILFSSLFLNKNNIVKIVSQKDNYSRTFMANSGDILNGKPIIILINNNTASAAEIVTSALKDNNRALVIGTQSYGKGYIQTLIPLEGSNDIIKLTTGYYVTPSGNKIQGIGISPDIIAEDSNINETFLSSITAKIPKNS